MFPAIAKHQDDYEKVKSMTRRSIKTSTYVMTPLLIGLAALSEPLVSWMLTDKWLPCVPYMRICCFYYMLQPVQTANLQSIRAIGRSDIILKLDIVKRGCGLLFLLLLMNHGVMGVALAPVGMSIVAIIVNIEPNKKLIKYTYWEQLLDLVPNFCIALIMGVFVFGVSEIMKNAGISNFLILLVGFVAGMTFYLIVSMVTKNETLRYIINAIKDYLHK